MLPVNLFNARWIPRWAWRMYKRTWIHRPVQHLCGALGGHDLRNDEWGYGGGAYVDRWCSCCDKCLKVPKEEEPIPHPDLKDAAVELGYFE